MTNESEGLAEFAEGSAALSLAYLHGRRRAEGHPSPLRKWLSDELDRIDPDRNPAADDVA